MEIDDGMSHKKKNQGKVVRESDLNSGMEI